MEKIIVTKQQASIIEESKDKDGIFGNASRLCYLEINTDLDLVTIARIVEGEEYEVKSDLFKVGDIVNRGTGPLFIVKGKNNPHYETTLEIMKQIGINQYKLVCKAENREDGI